MPKVMMPGFRIAPERLSRLQNFLKEKGVALTEAIEKSLDFLISSPHEVLEFKGKLFVSPRANLNLLKENGIISKAELVFILSFVNDAYNHINQSTPVNASWVRHLAVVFSLLFPLLTKNSRRSLNPEFLKYLPANGHGTEAKIENIQTYLAQCQKVAAAYANNLSQCVLILLRNGQYELSDETLKEIKSHLEPWCFWVAKRGMSDAPRYDMVNLDLLGKEMVRSEGDRLFLSGKKVRLKVFLSKEPTRPLGRKTNFSCGYEFPEKALVPFNLDTFYDLLQCLNQIKEGRDEVETIGDLTIYASPDSPGIKLGPPIIYLTQEEFDEFVTLTWKLFDREDVQVDLVKEYVEKYGAV